MLLLPFVDRFCNTNTSVCFGQTLTHKSWWLQYAPLPLVFIRGMLAFNHKTPSVKSGPLQADQTWVCVVWWLSGHLSADSYWLHTDSFHISHSQWPMWVLSVMVVSSLIAFCWACPLIPMSFSSLVVELATKPTSTERTFTFQFKVSFKHSKT